MIRNVARSAPDSYSTFIYRLDLVDPYALDNFWHNDPGLVLWKKHMVEKHQGTNYRTDTWLDYEMAYDRYKVTVVLRHVR